MIRTLIYAIIFCFSVSALPAQVVAITKSDINQMKGEWKGSLTYLDYSTKKPYTMPADLTISYLEKTNAIVFLNTYPNEPKANSADTVMLSKDGSMIDKETVRSRSVIPDRGTVIITEISGVDGNDNRPALIRHTYT